MRPTIDLSVYLVLDPDLCGGFDGMVETAAIASEHGATVVQLRAPDWKKGQIVRCARAIKALLDPMGVPLIINDHADVCVAVDAAGLHIGQSDLPVADARAIIGADRILGLSANTPGQIAAVDSKVVDYLGIGPIYATATKPDAAAPLGIEGFGALARTAPCPSVAIGSVKAGCARQLIQAGAAGLAVVSAICGQKDVAAATRELAALVRAARQPGA